MPIQINDGFQPNAPRYADLRSGKIVGGRSVPYASIAEALTAIPPAYRCEGLEFKVKQDGYITTYGFTDDHANGTVRIVGAVKGHVLAGNGELITLPENAFITGFGYKGSGTPVISIGTDELDPTDVLAEWDTSLSKGVATSFFCSEETTFFIAGLTGQEPIIIFYQ